MSEVRQDPPTRRWVVFATERAKRPSDFVTAASRPQVPERDENCPFCPGNEARTPPEKLAFRPHGGEPNGPGWSVRVVPNAFPALKPEGQWAIEDPGFYTRLAGIGAHEVLIESPRHNHSPGRMTPDEIAQVLAAAAERFLALTQDRRLSYIAFFRNKGQGAGCSLAHPHSQIIATPVAPTHIREEVAQARTYYDDRVSCAYCDVLRREKELGTRVVADTGHFLVFEPFASRWPFETWIVPWEHRSIIEPTEAGGLKGLAVALRIALGALHDAADDPDYNLVLHEAPLRDSCEDYYHWHIEIAPRLSTPAGFELGTGIWINTVMPEDAADYLRQFAAGQPGSAGQKG